jgi:hypothetical protein
MMYGSDFWRYVFFELQQVKMAAGVRWQNLMISVSGLACICVSCIPAHAQAALPLAPEMRELQVSLPEGGADTAPVAAQGIRGQAWRFDGENDFLPVAMDRQAQPLVVWSLACWIKLDDLPGPATHTLLTWRDAEGHETRLFVLRPEFKGRNYRLGFDHRQATLLTDDPNHLVSRITPTFTSEIWYHLGVTAGDGRIVFYIDGVPVHEEEVEVVPALAADMGRIGTDLAGEAAFAGAVDSVRVSPSTLTADQMARLYRDELGKTRLAANRELLLADFPHAASHLDEPESDWARALEAPYWYSKAWDWNEVQHWPEYQDDAVTVIAAFDSADKEGADHVCDGEEDDIEIQQALDAVPDTGGKVVLRDGTYHLSNVLLPKSNTELEINGLLRVDDAVSSALTRNTMRGDKSYHVADAGRFRVGQWVTAVDDNGTDHKGGWDNLQGGRKYGQCVVIAAIDGDAITVEEVPAEYKDRSTQNEPPRYGKDYLVDDHALLTTCHSAILVQGQRMVFIHGAGSIFGNRMNQKRTAPTSNWRRWEELRAGSGILVFDSSFVRVEGLTIHDANLHNLTFWMTENCTAEGLDVFGANDKNIAAVSTHRLRLFGNHAHDSVCEDGIIFYVLGHSALVGKNRLTDNPRFALRFHASCRFVTPLENVVSEKRINQ